MIAQRLARNLFTRVARVHSSMVPVRAFSAAVHAAEFSVGDIKVINSTPDHKPPS